MVFGLEDVQFDSSAFVVILYITGRDKVLFTQEVGIAIGISKGIGIRNISVLGVGLVLVDIAIV